jgi:hypothetical protein
MSHPLALAYNWRTPILVSTVGLVACVMLLVRQRTPGWEPTVAVLVGCWVALVVVVWARTRAYLEVDGPSLTVRRFHRKHVLTGPDVIAVRRARTLTGPGYRLTVTGGATHLVGVSLLRDGTATLLRWIVTHAPQATLDEATEAAISHLRTQGLVD